MISQAEGAFHRAVLSGIEVLRSSGYSPTRFEQMVGVDGARDAARSLLRGRDASDGFTTLWEMGRLDMSIEAMVLLPWYESLFTDDERATARRRLDAHGFDGTGYLDGMVKKPPQWWSDEVDGTESSNGDP